MAVPLDVAVQIYIELKVRDFIRQGGSRFEQNGSHRHYKHSSKPNVVGVPGHLGDDFPMGTLRSMFKATGLEKSNEREIHGAV